MTLATRLSWFFLGALAVALLGFSAVLYGLAHVHLHRQFGDRLQATLNTLAAAAEVEPDCVEWDLTRRHLKIDTDSIGPVLWEVVNERGQRVDGSREGESERVFGGRKGWQTLERRLQPEKAARRPLETKEHAAVVIRVAAPLEPVRAMLRRLALALVGLSLGLWLAAAFLGRRLCRRGLRPLTDMAQAARAITASDLGQRLPAADTGDELEDLGRAFNELLGRLQESFERQRRFTGDASHQLRTPLTAMLGQVEVSLRRDRDTEEYRRVLGRVLGQAVRLRQIVEALLFLARADAEARAPELERVELRQWLATHLQSWADHPRAGDLRQEPAELNGGPLETRVHPALLGQAVDNLLENACKYSDPGTPVVLRAWQEGKDVCLDVADRGRGIDAEDLPHVFEPFYRSGAARQSRSGGVGLGLAVAARIIASFGGYIEVKSEPRQGSLFTIRIPSDSLRQPE
jgi:heavy metal sensor kinase